jgi:hypothetical protein
LLFLINAALTVSCLAVNFVDRDGRLAAVLPACFLTGACEVTGGLAVSIGAMLCSGPSLLLPPVEPVLSVETQPVKSDALKTAAATVKRRELRVT